MLGKLEKVDLRQIWQTEGRDFTPWLAQKENLELLGDAIRIKLELEAQEKNIGPFRADILCKNTEDYSLVLIENQIERTVHIANDKNRTAQQEWIKNTLEKFDSVFRQRIPNL